MKKFTLIELLVTIAILGILMSIVLPNFTQAHEKTRAATCVNSLNNLGRANIMYSDDNAGFFVPTLMNGQSWSSNKSFRQLMKWDEGLSDNFMDQTSVCTEVYRKIKSSNDQSIYKVNESAVNSDYSYAPVHTANNNSLGFEGVRLDWIQNPSDLAAMGEVDNDSEMLDNGDLNNFSIRHRERTNLLFFDGHISSYSDESIQQTWSTSQEPFADSDGRKLSEIVNDN